jgi:hypothetical protein
MVRRRRWRKCRRQIGRTRKWTRKKTRRRMMMRRRRRKRW